MSARPDGAHPTLVPYDLRRLYTVEEFERLPEDNSFRYELQDGVIFLGPRPGWDHQIVFGQLGAQIDRQLPDDLAVAPAVDVDLELPNRAVVRAPDLMILRANTVRRSGLQKASGAMLVVEILSPGSVYLDTKIKPREYADAGIPNLWIVDPEPPVTATVYRLHGEAYEESQQAEHTFTVSEPCPLTIDLGALNAG